MSALSEKSVRVQKRSITDSFPFYLTLAASAVRSYLQRIWKILKRQSTLTSEPSSVATARTREDQRSLRRQRHSRTNLVIRRLGLLGFAMEVGLSSNSAPRVSFPLLFLHNVSSFPFARRTNTNLLVLRFCFSIGNNLVDCISTAHPSFLLTSEIDAVSVPVQILSPENDPLYTEDLKAYSNKVIPTLGIEYDYQYFPGLAHGFATRGDPNNDVQKKGLERAKNAVVYWFAQHLH